MPIPFAIVGPGRVGVALARRWQDAGLFCVGMFGRDASRVRDALAFVGAGEPLDAVGLRRAAVVAVTVGDEALAAVVAQLAAEEAVRRCALWMHTSGSAGLEVLAPCAERGARIGALHPLAPVPDRERGVASLAGRPALLEAGPRAAGLLHTLAERAGFVPILAGGPVDRPLYHAGCALAANGTTALLGLAADAIAAATRTPARVAAHLVAELGQAAAALVDAHGARAALSGPIVRGDVDVVRSHLSALAAGPRPDTVPAYRVIMREALNLARARGLDPAVARRIEAVLDGETVV